MYRNFIILVNYSWSSLVVTFSKMLPLNVSCLKRALTLGKPRTPSVRDLLGKGVAAYPTELGPWTPAWSITRNVYLKFDQADVEPCTSRLKTIINILYSSHIGTVISDAIPQTKSKIIMTPSLCHDCSIVLGCSIPIVFSDSNEAKALLATKNRWESFECYYSCMFYPCSSKDTSLLKYSVLAFVPSKK